MPDVEALLRIAAETSHLLGRNSNDFSYTCWDSRGEAQAELSSICAMLENDPPRAFKSLEFLFLPTGPLQELGLSSGWGDEYLELADAFDVAMAATACQCTTKYPFQNATVQDLGLDSDFAEVSVERCKVCGQYWLRYFYENEAFSRSARWYLGAIESSEAESVTIQSARAVLESLGSYFQGGRWFGEGVAQGSGRVSLTP